jgi:hypothetical protein
MTYAARYTEQERRIERYRALEREVTDRLALGLLRGIVLELEEELRECGLPDHPSDASAYGFSPRMRPRAP